MYFKPRDSAFYSFVVSMSPLKRYCMTLSMIACVMVAWLFFLYRPLSARITYYHNESVRLQSQCCEYRSIRKQCCLLEEEITTLQNELDICGSTCIHTTSSLCIADLVNCIKASDVVITSCAVQDHKKEGWYTQDVIAINGQGNIQQVCSFFEHISHMEHPLSCTQYSITSAGNNGYTISCFYSLHSGMKKPFNLEQAEGLGG